MENPANDTSDRSGPKPKGIQDLVIQRFGDLGRKYKAKGTYLQETAQAVPTHAADSKEILYDRLDSTLLPLLKDQLIAMLGFLEAAKVQEEQDSSLRRVCEIQAELDNNMTQIISTVHVLAPRFSSSSDRTNDQHLKHLKRYRLWEYRGSIFSAFFRICDVFQVASEYIQPTDLSRRSEEFMHFFHDLPTETHNAVSLIDLAVKRSKRSEMEVIEDFGERAVSQVDHHLINLITLTNPAAPIGFTKIPRLTRQPLINLATSAIPIVRLLHVFFKKLSKQGIMNSQTLPLASFTEMNSDQLEHLCQSDHTIGHDLLQLEDVLCAIDTSFEDRRLDIRPITRTVEQLASHLDAPFRSLLCYVVPLIDDVTTQNYYQGWFATWKTQMNLAICNFVQVAKDIVDPFA
ncbi:hypothetical protein PtB15_3B451 [Puccinia triticina]|nr:hypothetical protein PtB15_3B451 [Puccinia triticina]